MPRLKKFLLFLFFFFLFASLSPRGHAAIPTIAWYPDPQTDAELNKSVTYRDLQVHNTGAELYNASYYHDALMEDGTVIYNQFFVHNLGPGSNHASADLTIIEPDGKVYRQTENINQASFENTPDKFRIAFGDFSVEGNPQARPAVYRLKSLYGNLLGDDLTYTCEAPAYKDSGVYFNGDKNNYEKWVTYCPRGVVSGRIMVGGKWRQVKGRGFADHAAANPSISTGTALINGMGIFIRGSNPGFGFSLMEYRPLPNSAGVTMPGILVNIGDRNVIFTRDYKLDLDGWTDKGGGKFPTIFRLNIDRPGFKMKGEVRMERYLLSGSTLDGMSSKTARMIISKIAGDSRWARFVTGWKFDGAAADKKFHEEGRAIVQIMFSK